MRVVVESKSTHSLPLPLTAEAIIARFNNGSISEESEDEARQKERERDRKHVTCTIGCNDSIEKSRLTRDSRKYKGFSSLKPFLCQIYWGFISSTLDCKLAAFRLEPTSRRMVAARYRLYFHLLKQSNGMLHRDSILRNGLVITRTIQEWIRLL